MKGLSRFISIGLLFLASVSAGAADSSDCRAQASDAGLSQSRGAQLCRQEGSGGPVQCFLSARDSVGLGVENSINLCRCARSTGPADCVKTSMQKYHMGLQDALLSCRNANRKDIAQRQCLGADFPPG